MPWKLRSDAARSPATVLTLKVALAADKDIWRRIAIRSDQSLDDFHEAIFKAFDRDEEHMYSFYLPESPPKGELFLGAPWLQDAAEYSRPEGGEGIDAEETSLRQLDLKPGQTILYLFDYGDEWWHRIAVESTDGRLEKGKYPRVVEKQGDSPDQYPDDEDEDEEADDETEE